jgi:hypothetical protein
LKWAWCVLHAVEVGHAAVPTGVFWQIGRGRGGFRGKCWRCRQNVHVRTFAALLTGGRSFCVSMAPAHVAMMITLWSGWKLADTILTPFVALIQLLPAGR